MNIIFCCGGQAQDGLGASNFIILQASESGDVGTGHVSKETWHERDVCSPVCLDGNRIQVHDKLVARELGSVLEKLSTSLTTLAAGPPACWMLFSAEHKVCCAWSGTEPDINESFGIKKN